MVMKIFILHTFSKFNHDGYCGAALLMSTPDCEHIEGMKPPVATQVTGKQSKSFHIL